MVATVLAALVVGCSQSEQDTAPASDSVLFYRSPMDPNFISGTPGKDAMGMDLVPVYAGDPEADLNAIAVDGAVVQRMGVRLAPVTRGSPTRIVRALGRVVPDETRVSKINMKFDGWVEQIRVNETGQHVDAGSPLFSVYSPELVASQEEFIQVLNSTAKGPHTEHLMRSARDRLLQFDVPETFVEEIERTRSAKRTVTIVAPTSGYVIHKEAFEGTFVKRGVNLYTLADLDALWILAEVYEFDAPWLSPGQSATIELDYLPGRILETAVDYVYPVLDEKSRTLTVRLLLPNPDVILKPGMFATVRIHVRPLENVLTVPADAVIHSGERNVVFIARGDGRFEPRELQLGMRGNDVYQVLDGVQDGERVVVSGQFLLGSEASLKDAVKKMLGTNVSRDTKATEEQLEGGHAGSDH